MRETRVTATLTSGDGDRCNGFSEQRRCDIFDLRDNHGGDPRMVSLIAAYLFDHPKYIYNPTRSPTLHSLDAVARSRKQACG